MKKFILFFALLAGTACGPRIKVHHNPVFDKDPSPQGIVGGSLVGDQGFAKHVVGIYNNRQNYWCTGTLIDKNLILTAAHCVLDGHARNYTIYFGKQPQTSQARRVEDLKYHTRYNAQAYTDRSDVAVMRFAGDLPAGFTPAALPTPEELKKAGRNFIATGYGSVTARRDIINTEAGVLRYTNVSMQKNLTADKADFNVIQTNGRGICFGDSGGPAFVQFGERYVIIGVASAVYSTDKEARTRPDFDICRYVAIYTSPFYYSDWIQEAADELRE